MGTETRGQTQDWNGVRRRGGSESSSGDGNGDEDGSWNGNEDWIGDGEREVKKHNKLHKRCTPCGKRGRLG